MIVYEIKRIVLKMGVIVVRKISIIALHGQRVAGVPINRTLHLGPPTIFNFTD